MRRIDSTYDSKCSGASHFRIVWPMYGVRPKPPPTRTSKPTSPCSFLCIRKPMSCTATAARSFSELVLRAAGILVRRDVAHAVARRLDARDLDVGEMLQDVGHLLELDPVVLDVLPSREMAEVLVVGARDEGEFAHLPCRQSAVRDVDTQHVRVQLQVQAVHEAQRTELILRQLASEAALHLAPKLRNSLVDEASIEFIVAVHGLGPVLFRPLLCRHTSVRSVRTVGPNARIARSE